MPGPIIESIPVSGPRCQPSDRERVGTLDAFTFQFDQPDNTDFLLGYDWPFGAYISQLRITCSGGTGTVSVLINGVKVTGIDTVPIAAGSRSRHTAEGLNKFLPGDDIVLRIESGAPLLLNVRGSLVITAKSVFGLLDVPVDPRLQEIELPISGSLESVMQIPFNISPKLTRNPITIFNGYFVKTDPNQSDIIVNSITPFTPGDYTLGWYYNLSAPSVPGQILRSGYIR